MSLTRQENEKIVDCFSGKEIKNPYGPCYKPSKKSGEKDFNEENSAARAALFDLIINGDDFPKNQRDESL